MRAHVKNLATAALATTVVLLLALAPPAALAAPPATQATCAGIAAAYPILGVQCQKAYDKINHAPANAAERLTTYKARAAVLVIFRKAALCNGMYGANKAAQSAFLSGEQGHITALAGLRVAMTAAGDPDPGDPPDLTTISMNKQQCK